MADHTQATLRSVAKSRIVQGAQDIMGTVWQVWRQGGEQKIQALLGMTLDGNPILSAWTKVETQHGTHREQHKFHKGQNVKISGGVSADPRQASITPYGENTAHPEPKYANDYHHTYSHGDYHFRKGPAHHDRFITQSQQGGGSGGGQAQSRLGATSGSSSSGSSSQQSDPYQDAILVHRHGFKPQVQQQQGPWDGPDPNSPSDGNQPGQQHLHWAGDQGEVPDLGQDKVHHVQFGGKTKTRHTDGMKQSTVQSQGFAHSHRERLLRSLRGEELGAATGGGVDQSACEHVMTSSYNVNHVGQQSYHYITNQEIDTNTTNHYIAAQQSAWLHAGSTAHIHGSPILTNQMVLHGSHSPPSASFSGIFHRLGWTDEGLREPVTLMDEFGTPIKIIKPKPKAPLKDDSYPGDDYYIANGASFTASYASDHPPSNADPQFAGTNAPWNGFRWTDTTNGIEYSYYNGVWSEGGGDISFPANPTMGQTFAFAGREWIWDGVGWHSSLHERVTHLDTSGTDGQLLIGQTVQQTGDHFSAYKTVTGDLLIDKDGVAALEVITSAQNNVGSSSAIPVISIDDKGRVTALGTTSISGITNPQIALVGSVAPPTNGVMMIELTSDTTLTFRVKGSDGVVRSAALTLA